MGDDSLKFALDKYGREVRAEEALNIGEYTCLRCKKRVLLCTGEYKRNYFSHYRPSKVKGRGETKRHVAGKKRIISFLKAKGFHVDDEQYIASIRRRVDIVVMMDDEKYFVEYQCSPIELNEIRQRKKDYELVGTNSIWIAGPYHMQKNLFATVQKFAKKSFKLGVYFIFWDALKQNEPQVFYKIQRNVLGGITYNLALIGKDFKLYNKQSRRKNNWQSIEWEVDQMSKLLLGNRVDSRYLKTQQECYENNKNLLGCPWIVHFPRKCQDFYNNGIPLLNRVSFLILAAKRPFITNEDRRTVDTEFWNHLLKRGIVSKVNNGWRLLEEKITWYKDADEKKENMKKYLKSDIDE
ncbi:competence protein [Pediococcus stilesii]|uniref:Competence protein n=1 Tax=Pediococcus stilesii TaxID=331679 RepID=A0A0R2L512_9LACO|nr:competence protein [Pediococcus stilesii]